MDIFSALVLLATGGLLLYFGGEYLVKGASSFALRKGVSLLVIGLTIVSIGTSAPELFVSLLAGFDGKTEISVGNIIGSNIANVGLVLGIAALIRPLSIRKSTIRIEVPFVLAASFLLLITVIDGSVSRTDGVIYLAFSSLFLIYCFKNRHGVDSDDVGLLPTRWQDWCYIMFGIVGLFVGGEYFVKGSIVFARMIGFSDFAIGLTVVALGTSLPELATSVVAAMNNKDDISVGNVLGSNIFNILYVLGIVSLMIPLPCDPVALKFDLPIMILLPALIIPFGWKYRLGRFAGCVLLFIYIGYIAAIVIRNQLVF